MGSFRNELHLRIYGRDWRVVRWSDVRPGEVILHDPVIPPDSLMTAASESLANGIWDDLRSESWGNQTGFGADWVDLWKRLDEGIRFGRLVVVAGYPFEMRQGGGAPAAPQAPVAAVDPPKKSSTASTSTLKKLTWVAIRLVGPRNTPIANEKYRVTLPDGNVTEGTLNSSGEAWIENIDPGNCQITFPALDALEWHS